MTMLESKESSDPEPVIMSHPCFIVPPNLLRAIAESTINPEHVRKAAHASLAARERIGASRQQLAETLTRPRGPEDSPPQRCSPFIPEGVLTRLSISEAVDEATREGAKRDLEHLQTFMAKPPPSGYPTVAAADSAREARKDIPKEIPYRAVYDAKMARDEDGLPGKLIRAESEAKVEDLDVNLAYDNVGHVLDFYKEYFQWKSINNKNADVISSVHFGHHFENAFWDPDKLQMVFGDGGEFLQNFTGIIDVIGHELTHAITEHTSPLHYMDRPGALNEHISDVFGIMIKQKIEDETAEEDWLVGEGCLLPGIKGVALRSMKSPGTAYDDARFCKDPQVDNMKMYEKTYEDSGGVHIFSGIPNKAFYLVAVALGGYSWEKAGQIWWKAMASRHVPPRCTFEQFADVTVDCAKTEFGLQTAEIVRKAWSDVGVTRSV